MRYDVNELVEIVRVETENQDVTDTIGIQDKEIIRFLNIAQRQLQSKIMNVIPNGSIPNEFISTIDAVRDPNSSNGRVYKMPIDSFLRGKILSFRDGQDLDCVRRQVYIRNISYEKGCCANSTCFDYSCYRYLKYGYAIQGNRLYLTGGRLECDSNPQITYVKTLPDLDKSLLSVDPLVSVNMQSGVLQLTTKTSFDAQELKTSRRYSLVDEEGTQFATNIKIASFDSGTRTITLSDKNDSVIVDSDEELFLVRGENSSTHTSFDDLARDYLTRYAIAKVLQRDGSSEYQVHSADLITILNEVLDAYINIDNNLIDIPHFSEDY